MVNYIDRMADALVDVLKYSDSTVEWVEVDDMKKNDGVLAEWFYPAVESEPYSEITAILQYTQQEASFEEIGELMLGIALVEMKHYATVRDIIVKLGGTIPRQYSNRNVEIGGSVSEALQLAAQAEIATIDFYRSIIKQLTADTETVRIAKQILGKLIADETLHLKMINQQLIVVLGNEYKDKMVNYIQKIKSYLETV